MKKQVKKKNIPSAARDASVASWFGANLASLLSKKIQQVYPEFNKVGYRKYIASRVEGRTYSERLRIHAEALAAYLPEDYTKALPILLSILGEENANETGMFKQYYWALPIGKFIELYGLQHVDASLAAIAELTKRSTGEYAIRPFLQAYPAKTMKVMGVWSRSKNFHLRRLASEGCRPKLPWAAKLTVFIENPAPVFLILSRLMEDEVLFVRRSVANNLADYLKVNPSAARAFMRPYRASKHPHTQWILKHAERSLKV